MVGMERAILVIISFILVSLGQPAWCWWCGLISAVVGFAIFWKAMLSISVTRNRFLLGFGWAFAIQLVHNSWFISHPFLYIYPVWLLFSGLCALQFGLICFLISADKIRYISHALFIASLWTLMEWARLFFMSGYTWNPVGLSLTGHLFPMQIGSLVGVYGMSFWVMFVNLLFLRAWVSKEKTFKPFVLWTVMALIPYLYGFVQVTYHDRFFTSPKTLSALLVQPAFAPEEVISFTDRKSAIRHVMDEWNQILLILSRHKNSKIDLIVLPEYTVPYGTYSAIYPLDYIQKAFEAHYGKDVLQHLPHLEEPWASQMEFNREKIWFVNNAYISQAISNIFQADVVIGLEDAEFTTGNEKAIYSAAICFHCDREEERYEKRVLVPMGEYIPFEFCREMAAVYGVTGSFTAGKTAKIFQAGGIPIGCCICYEETFGDLMRENKMLGAEALVNITSDVWYPNSRLPQQHFDHARLRTVEGGIPLLRACNTGITCAVDSLGRVVSSLGEGDENFEWISDALKVDVPLYSYFTVYSRTGDTPLIGFCLIMTFLGFYRPRT